MIKVIIVSDWPVVRYGIRALLERQGNCTIVGESTDAAEIIDLVRTHQPDVVLIDGALTSIDALELAQILQQHDAGNGMFVLAPSKDEERLFQFVRLGVVAYELSTLSLEELVEKVSKVSQGEYLISGDVLTPLPRPIVSPGVRYEARNPVREAPQKPSVSPLSYREIEILEYIARGNSNKEIAKTLKISDQTVKNHITSILKKLGVNDRTAAVVYALCQRWIEIEKLVEEHASYEAPFAG